MASLAIQFSDSLKWANCIRRVYPTMLFYFTQTYNQTIVIFFTDDTDDTIRAVYTKLDVDSLASACALPTNIYETYFRMLPVGDSKTRFLLPGVENSEWTRTGKKMLQGTRVLVNITGIVTTATKTIDSVYLVFIDKVTKALEWECVECSPHIKECIADMTGSTWNTLKTVLNMSK
jgi:hypothetical protein